MPAHAVGLINTTSTVRPGIPFYVQGDFIALGGAGRSLSNVPYETIVTLRNTAGAATATVIAHSTRFAWMVSTSGTTVTLLEGADFTGQTGSIWISGTQYTIATVDTATQITLTGSAGTQVSALAAAQAPVATYSLATPSKDAPLEHCLRSVDKTYSKYIALAVTAISGTGASVSAYCRVF